MNCQICHKRPAVHVHHKDGDRTNNEASNLLYLCTKCHGKVHRRLSVEKLKSLKRSKRCFHTLLAEVCQMTESPKAPTDIYYALKISGVGYRKYIDIALALGFIQAQNNQKLKRTERGSRYLEAYQLLEELLAS